MQTLRALPDRVILEFPPPVEKIGSIIISPKSQVRPEFGKIHDIGEALSDETRMIASNLRDLQARGKRIAVTFSSGIGYATDSQGNALEAEEWKWLDKFRSYRITELAAYVEES